MVQFPPNPSGMEFGWRPPASPMSRTKLESFESVSTAEFTLFVELAVYRSVQLYTTGSRIPLGTCTVNGYLAVPADRYQILNLVPGNKFETV